jgi:type IV secretory pathway VirB2 component (pilin)
MYLRLIPFDVDVPDIDPDFSAPWMQGLQTIASYVLGTLMIVVLILLMVAGAALAFRGLASDRVRTWAGENIMWIFIATAVLGSASALFQWFIGFDFGF